MRRNEFIRRVSGVVAGASLFPVAAAGSGRKVTPWPPVEGDEEQFWKFVRSQFPLTNERVYFNTGGLGASPYSVIDAVKGKMDELERISETGHADGLWKEIKADAATLLGCAPEELAFMRNTTEGINVVALGLPFKSGDEIITTTHEHVANSITWIALKKRRGVNFRFMEPSTDSAQENIDRIEHLITKRTRLISIPHITTTTGQIFPIKEIAALAKRKNVWFFVDGAQSMGMMPFSLHDLGCDAYATSGHKWLLGPKETGLLYVQKDMLDVIEPQFVGAYSDNGFNFQKGELAFHPTAQRYEYGTVNIPLRVGFHEAVKFIQRIGINNVWKRDKALSNYLAQKLGAIPGVTVVSPRSDSERSAMISFRHEKLSFLELQSHLSTFDLRTRGVSEGGVNALRISCHIYNSFDELDRLIHDVQTAWKG